MFQFTIAKIHFYFKFIPMCVWVGGGGVLNKEMELCSLHSDDLFLTLG